MSLEVWKDNTSPAIQDTITVSGVAQDLSGCTVSFRLREEGAASDAALKVDAAATFTTDGTDGQVEYAWQAGDTDTPGDYLGWWHVVFPGGGQQDTPEFQVQVLDHGLSNGALCAVSDVREFLTWPTEDTTQDRKMQSLILGASEEIMAECGREFAPKVTETRRFILDWRQRRDRRGNFVVVFGDRKELRSATTVQLDPDEASPLTLTAGSHYALEPLESRLGVYDRMKVSAYQLSLEGYSNAAVASVLNFGYSNLDVTGDWGFATIPEDVKRIAIAVVAGWMQSDVSQFGQAETQAPFGPAVPAGYELPLFAKRSLNKWRRQVAF